MRKKVLLFFMLFFAVFFRFYNLGLLPHGMTWDEAAIGYNGHAIFVNKTDEWLQVLPVSFRSFGDYKAPLAIYLSGVFTSVFGMNLWAVRLPFALSGILSVVVFYFLLRKIYFKNTYREFLSIFGAVLMIFSPWHIHFSRIGFESGISLFLLLISLVGFFSFITNTQRKNWICNSLFLSMSVIAAVGSLYSYHSAKITAPLLFLSATFIFLEKKMIIKYWKIFLGLVASGTLLLLPLVKDSLYGYGATRSSVLIFSEQMHFSEYVKIIFSNVASVFSFSFLVFGKTDTLRHGTGSWGVLLIPTFLLCLAGLCYLVSQIVQKQYGNSFRITLFSLLFLVFGTLPSIITTEPVHPNRTLLALPGFLLLATQGVEFFIICVIRNFSNESQRKILFKSAIGIFICVYAFSFISYWEEYTTIFAKQSAPAFQDGYLEVFQIASEYEKGTNSKEKVDKIVFSNEYGQPYIFALFVRKTNPIWYQAGSLQKYEFVDTITDADLHRKDTLVVATQNNLLDTTAADYLVYGSDGRIRFALYRTKGQE